MNKKVTNELIDLQARIHDFHQALDSLSFSSSVRNPKQNSSKNKDLNNKSPPKSAKKRDRDVDSIYSRDSHRIEGSMRTAELLSDRELEFYRQQNKKNYSVSSRAAKSNAANSYYRSPMVSNKYSQRNYSPFSYVNQINANTPSAQSNYQQQGRYMFSRRQEASPYLFQRGNNSISSNYSPVSTRYIPSPQFQLTRSSNRSSSKKMPTVVLSSSSSSSEEEDLDNLPSPVYPDSDDDLDLKKVPTLEELTGESELYYSRASSRRARSRQQYDSYSEASSVHYKPIPPKKIKNVQEMPPINYVNSRSIPLQQPQQEEEEEYEGQSQQEPMEEEEEEEEERYEPQNNQYPDINSTATMDQHEKKTTNIEMSKPLSFSCQSSKNMNSEVEIPPSEYTYLSEEEYNEQSYLDKQSYYSYYTTGQSQVEREGIPITQYQEQDTQTIPQKQPIQNRNVEKPNNLPQNPQLNQKQQQSSNNQSQTIQNEIKQELNQKEDSLSDVSLVITSSLGKSDVIESSIKSQKLNESNISSHSKDNEESLTEINLPNDEPINPSKETQTDQSDLLNNSKDAVEQKTIDETPNQNQNTEKANRIDGEYISKLFRDLPLLISSSDDDDDLIIFNPPIPDKVIIGDPLAKPEFKPVLEKPIQEIPEKWNSVGETPPEMFKQPEEEEEQDQDTNLITQDTFPPTPGATSSDGWGVPMGSSPSQSQANMISESEPISYVTTKQEPFVSVTDTDLTKIDDLASLPNSETTKKTTKEAPPLPIPDIQTSTYEEGASSSYFCVGEDIE